MIPGVAQAVVERVLAKEKAAMERWRHGDPMGWADISADDVSYVDPDLTEPIRGLAGYRDYLESLAGKIQYDGSEFINPVVAVYGEVAVLTYNYVSTVRGPDGGVLRQTPWNSTEVYALLEGEWKIIHSHWSYVDERRSDNLELTPPVNPPQSEYRGVLGELLFLEEVAMERWRWGDPQGFLELSADEVTCFDTGTPRRIDGLDALKAEYETRVGKAQYDLMQFVDPHVQIYGDVAVLSYRYFSTVLNADGSIASRTPWNRTEVFVKRRGEWKIVHIHWSYTLGRRR
jgi:ketosteroid isomerase-like protein